MNSDFAIVEQRDVDGLHVLVVDTNKATFQEMKWKNLGERGRKKFENLLVLLHANERIKIVYR